jgi:hypothetical protein
MAAQSFGQYFELLRRSHCAIKNYQIALAEPTGTAPSVITYLPQDPLAANLEPQTLSRFGQLIDQVQQSRTFVTHREYSALPRLTP